MKKRLAAVLLFILILSSSVLSSCTSVIKPKDAIIKVYTVYGITGDSTKPEAIRQVELAMNRILITNFDVAIKLMLFPEDEYDQAVQDAFDEMEAYELKKKEEASASKAAALSNKNKPKEQASDGSVAESGLTADMIYALLESGAEIPLDVPRIDIFLVRGKEDYYKFADEGKFTKEGIIQKLASDGKALTKFVNAFFMANSSTKVSAANYNGKAYGVPNNGPIGEYEYLVYDKELLQKYEFDAPSLKTLEDVEFFLEAVKAGEKDVVPLTGTTTPNNVSFLFQDGFPVAVDDKGYVFGTYLSEELEDYYRMLNRFRSKGYLPEGELKDDQRFAVTIVKGNISDIEALERETGREYEYVIYKNPIGTADNLLENVFAISKACVAEELTEAVKILKVLNTDTEVRNIFQYGVINENYILNDDNQVVRLNEDYMMNREQTGNQFLCYTLEGEDPDIWEAAKKQNLEATLSPFISLNFKRLEVQAETPDVSEEEPATDESAEVSETSTGLAAPSEAEESEAPKVLEPDYKTLYTNITNKYYDDLVNGTGDFDAIWSAIQSELEEAGDGYIKALTTTFYKQIRAASPNYPTEPTPYDYMSGTDATESAAS